MIGAVVVSHTFIALINLIYVFFSVLSAIFAINYTIKQMNERKLKNFFYFSFIAIAYFILIFIPGA